MTKLTKKQYKDLAEKVGVEKMKDIEDASGVSTGLLDSTEQPPKSKTKPKDSEVTVNIDCTKEESLKAMKKQGCTVAEYNIAKYGEPDYVLNDHKETKVQTEQIATLYEELTGYLIQSFDVALRIGEILFNLKENHIKRGKFGSWMKQNLPFSERTGQRYMQIYQYREGLAKKEIKGLADAYLEINGDPLDDEELEVDDGADTTKKWEVVSTTIEVDNIKLPKKKLTGPQETVQINLQTVESMEQRQLPFNTKHVKLVVTVPSSAERKSLLSRFIIAAGDLLVPGGKLIFVKRK